MRAPTYRIKTLGCRVNHAESRELEAILSRYGLTPATENQTPDLHVVHSCSVTHAAARKSRHAARRAARSTNGEVILTGCYVGTNADEAASIVGSDHAIPHDAADDTPFHARFERALSRWVASFQKKHAAENNTTHPRITTNRSPYGQQHKLRQQRQIIPLPVLPTRQQTASRHIRAELKIQDGCDAHCTFCIIPKIRPVLRTKRISDALDEARRLVDLGHSEIVLTGIFIGAYGHETALRRRQQHPQRTYLAELLDAVAQVDGVERLRISSMEPGDVTEALLDAMVANAPIVVPHLHLPLQSGSDSILRRMNRQYRVSDYLEMIDMVNGALTTDDGLPPAITTDIICGFPGETEHDFDATVDVAQRVGYLHMHVFPYSPRAGTAAARWRDQFVNPDVARSRVRTLIALETDPDDGFAIRFHRRLLGRTLRVIIEQPDSYDPSVMTGRCDHYALVRIPRSFDRGHIVEARIVGASPDAIAAEPVESPVSLPILG